MSSKPVAPTDVARFVESFFDASLVELATDRPARPHDAIDGSCAGPELPPLVTTRARLARLEPSADFRPPQGATMKSYATNLDALDMSFSISSAPRSDLLLILWMIFGNNLIGRG
jgi:hypothetical protein